MKKKQRHSSSESRREKRKEKMKKFMSAEEIAESMKKYTVKQYKEDLLKVRTAGCDACFEDMHDLYYRHCHSLQSEGISFKDFTYIGLMILIDLSNRR